MDKKQSVKNAIDRYLAKQLGQSKPKRKNKSPEKEVQQRLFPVLEMLGIFANVVESKAVYSASAGRYLSGQAASGFPDLIGCNNAGCIVAIELKSPGKRSTLRPAQRAFLLRVIASNGFACVTDSVDHFSAIYSKWLLSDSALKKSVLMNDLPVKRNVTNLDDVLFSDDD